MPRTDAPGNFQPVDKAKLKASLDRLWEIYRQIGENANLVSKWRCPYKNAQDCCTARFGCRNQSRRHGSAGLPLCTGSDDLDYRDAWEA